MRKGIIVALATLAMGLTGLFASPAKGLQFGFSTGYSSVGFQLNGASGEFLFGFQGKDEHRPQGSVLRIGLMGASGTGETDLTKAKWNGQSLEGFVTTTTIGAVNAAIATVGGPAVFGQLPATQQQAILGQVAQGVQAGFDAYGAAYGITDLSKAEGHATAFIISAAYEYVLAQGAPGLGFIVGGELYISDGGYSSSNPQFPSVSTSGGIGGGGVVGISYYLKNGFNLTVKTGLGIVDPGKVVYNILGASVEVEPESSFYASPTFSLGFLY